MQWSLLVIFHYTDTISISLSFTHIPHHLHLNKSNLNSRLGCNSHHHRESWYTMCTTSLLLCHCRLRPVPRRISSSTSSHRATQSVCVYSIQRRSCLCHDYIYIYKNDNKDGWKHKRSSDPLTFFVKKGAKEIHENRWKEWRLKSKRTDCMNKGRKSWGATTFTLLVTHGTTQWLCVPQNEWTEQKVDRHTNKPSSIKHIPFTMYLVVLLDPRIQILAIDIPCTLLLHQISSHIISKILHYVKKQPVTKCV